MIEEARRFAYQAHEGQRYGENPYTYHLEQVVLVLKRFNVTDPDILAAGWLHDSLEDTPTTKQDLVDKFGTRIADLVDAVTDGEGETRELRKARPYQLIPTVEGAAQLKLADRIANLEASLREGHDRLLKRYAKEHAKFTKALYDGQNLNMWRRLQEIFIVGRCDSATTVVPIAKPNDGGRYDDERRET